MWNDLPEESKKQLRELGVNFEADAFAENAGKLLQQKTLKMESIMIAGYITSTITLLMSLGMIILT